MKPVHVADLYSEPGDKIERLIKAAAVACFVVETIAHLKGREHELLPIADELRAAIKLVRS